MGQPTALVTGATSGIGKAIAVMLCQQGYKVIALGRNKSALEKLQAYDGMVAVQLDLNDRKTLPDSLKDDEVDVLVNNAGIMPPVISFEDMEQSLIDSTIEINLSAAIAITRLVLPNMIKRRAGHIFFTGSTAGQSPFPNMAVYGATKSAISSFAAALRCDISGTGVRVTEIVAGRVETDLYRNVLNDDARKKMYSAFNAVQPQDVASMLASVLNMPSYVDVTRFDILPTAQFVGGGGFANKEDIKGK